MGRVQLSVQIRNIGPVPFIPLAVSCDGRPFGSQRNNKPPVGVKRGGSLAGGFHGDPVIGSDRVVVHGGLTTTYIYTSRYGAGQEKS